MHFKDEFEYEIKGQTYYVEVSGQLTDYGTELDNVTISDDMGEIDSTHEHYDEIYSYTQDRDYEVEVHHTDFEYYNSDFDNFLRERDEF
jgi:hypothetical protein